MFYWCGWLAVNGYPVQGWLKRVYKVDRLPQPRDDAAPRVRPAGPVWRAVRVF